MVAAFAITPARSRVLEMVWMEAGVWLPCESQKASLGQILEPRLNPGATRYRQRAWTLEPDGLGLNPGSV